MFEVFEPWQRHGTQRLREQRCLYSCQQGQIGQLDCDITANCGKTYYTYYRIFEVFYKANNA